LSAERLLLSALLANPGRHEGRLARVDPSWLEDEVLSALLRLLRRRPSTLAGLVEHLRSKKPGRLRDRLLAVLPALADVGRVEDVDVDQAAREIADRAKRRAFLDRMRAAIEALDRNELGAAEDVVSRLAAELPTFDVRGEAVEDLSSMAEAVLREHGAVREAGATAYIPTGFRRLDEVVGGGQPGDLWLWAAYASEGKSTSALSVAYHAWLSGRVVCWIALEMKSLPVGRLLLARHSCTLFPDAPLLTREVARGCLDEEGERKLRETVADVKRREAERRCWWSWRPPRSTTIRDVERRMEALRSATSVDLLVIDYLELLRPFERRRAAREELNDTLGEAKELAATYAGGRGLWLLSPHQISRDGRKECERRKPVPHYLLSDLAESSRAERDSDVVCWTLRTRKLKTANQVVIGVCKARGEETIPLGFKAMADYRSAFVADLVDEESEPDAERDFDPVD